MQPSVDQHQSSSSSQTPLMWPSIGGVPLNEFTTEGYFTCAFPTLFPTGAGDFLSLRQVPVTIGNYIKDLMQYDDGRFAKHPRFRYIALNTEMRHHALQNGRVYIRQHPGDAQLSLDELRDMVGRQGEAFSSRVLQSASVLQPPVCVEPSSTGNVSGVVCWTEDDESSLDPSFSAWLRFLMKGALLHGKCIPAVRALLTARQPRLHTSHTS